MTKLKLYGDADYESPYVFSVYVTLLEKGLDFEYCPVDLGQKQQSTREFGRISLTRKVPALEHGDFQLSESLAIVEYLEEAFPDAPRVLPVELRERARARQVMAWLRSDLGDLRAERPSETIFRPKPASPLSPPAQRAAGKLIDVATQLLGGRGQLFQSHSAADADLAFMLQRLVANGDDVPETLSSFARAEWLRPSVKGFVSRAQQRP